MTSEAARAEMAAAQAEQQEKEQVNEEKQRKKAEAAAQTTARRIAQGENIEFKGAVHSRNKEGLQDIAYALGLSLEGTKAVLVERINDYLDNNPQLKDDNRFARLFASRARGQKRTCPEDDSVTTAPAQRPHRCLEDVINVPAPSPSH